MEMMRRARLLPIVGAATAFGALPTMVIGQTRLPRDAATGDIVAAAYSATPNTFCNGASDDAAVLDRAIASANGAGGRRIILPTGTCRIASPLMPLSFGTRLICQGPFATILTPTADMKAMVTLARRQAGVFDCGFVDMRGHAASGIEISKDHDDIPAYVRGNVLRGLAVGILHSKGDFPDIEFNTCLGCGVAIKVTDDGTGGMIANNYASGGQGILVSKGQNTTEKLSFVFNQMIATGYAMHISHCLFCIATGNTLTQQSFVPATSAFALDAGSGDVKSFVSRDNFIGAAEKAPPGSCAAFIQMVFNFVSSGDSFVASAAVGNSLCIDRSVDVHVSQPIFDRTVTGAADIIATGAANLLIDHASFYGAMSVKTDAVTYGRLDASTFNNTPPDIPQIGGRGFLVGAQGNGLVTRNIVPVTVAPGTTSVVFEHGVWKAPAPAEVTAHLHARPAKVPSAIWIDRCNLRTCTLNLSEPSNLLGTDYSMLVDVTQ